MDLFILKTNVEKFTSTYEKTLHMIFKECGLSMNDKLHLKNSVEDAIRHPVAHQRTTKCRHHVIVFTVDSTAQHLIT